MSSTANPSVPIPKKRLGNISSAWSARIFLSLLARLAYGQIVVTLPNGSQSRFVGAQAGSHAQLYVHDGRAFGRILRRGDIGLAEAYRDGWLDFGAHEGDGLRALLLLAIENEAVLKPAIDGSRLGTWWGRLRHALRANTRAGSRRNIHAHYDIGNDFYRLWLDGSMTYSAAIFSGRPDDLATAQAAKYQRISQVLKLKAGQSVLEIGCGWGGFAQHAASLGCQVSGITLSTEQLDYAKNRLAMAGLQADLSLTDYRDVAGQYDAIVSIEMLEAVGERWWPTYFERVRDLLRPGGRALIQVITLRDTDFAHYRHGTDFIQQYIFPGGMLPSIGVLRDHVAAAGLHWGDLYAFGLDYAETLRLWRERFETGVPHIREQGFDLAFERLWRFYLVYCEVGFLTERTDVIQLEIHRDALPPQGG